MLKPEAKTWTQKKLLSYPNDLCYCHKKNRHAWRFFVCCFVVDQYK